jgi:hypothetical protein
LVAEDERAVGLILAQHSEKWPVYAYHYAYWDTIHYYSRERPIAYMNDNQELDESFFLVMPTALYHAVTFPPELSRGMEILYEGEAVTLADIHIP